MLLRRSQGDSRTAPLTVGWEYKEAVLECPNSISQRRKKTTAWLQTLLREYEADLGIDLCFQGFPEELESLERMYGPPGGRFLLLRVEEETAGCVALVDSGGRYL